MNFNLAAIDKGGVMRALLAMIDQEILVLKSSVANSVDAATHEENKPENKYDTRALEASYLAGAQSERLSELTSIRQYLTRFDLSKMSERLRIEAGCLIELTQDGRGNLFYYLLPFGGGYQIEIGGIVIKTITSESPLGQALMAKKKSDLLSIGAGESVREFEVVDFV